MKLNTLLSVLLFLVVSNAAFGQSISIFEIDTTNFPIMKAKFYAFDKDGNQVRPSASELSVTEDGVPRTITNISCPAPKPPSALSSVLVIDVSGSMSGGNINLAKAAANAWVNGLPLGKSECAISTFNHNNYINQDFTKDRSKLLNAINQLSPSGGTNYDAALITPIAGGLQISKNGKFKKVIILLTDGQAGPPQINSIVSEANIQDCIIYSVTLGMPCPQSLKDIATQTGGQCFENVTTIEEATNVYQKLLRLSQGTTECTIEWESEVPCQKSEFSVEMKWQTQKSYWNYKIPFSALASLDITSRFTKFGKCKPSTVNFKTITIFANKINYSITAINQKNGSSDFVVVNTVFPILIKKNTSVDIQIKFSPSDSSLQFASFEIETDKCTDYISVTGGYPGIKNKKSSLKLIIPNGGEEFIAGSDTLIQWGGVSTLDTVSLEYSIDNGLNWKNITKVATGLKFIWKNIPIPTSSKCLIKVEQLQSSNDSLGQVVHTLLGHTDDVVNVAISPDGNILASGSLDRTVKLWDINTGQLLKTLTRHNDGVMSVAFSPEGTTLATGSLDNNIFLWDINSGIVIDLLAGTNGFVHSIAFSPDGTKIASGCQYNTIKLWDVKTSQEILTFTGHQAWVLTVAFSYDGLKLVSGSNDNNVLLWDITTGKLLKTFTGHKYLINSVCFSPNDKIIASCSDDKTVKLWDVDSGLKSQTIDGFIHTIKSVAFSPDGERIASNVDENKINLWNLKTLNNIVSLQGHNETVRSIAFSPDGTLLVSSSNDNSIIIWRVDLLPIQSDQSDAVFSIVAPSPSSKDIDMKECLVGVSKDSLVSEFVINKGSYPYRVDSVYFTGADASAFSQVSGLPKFMVDTNSSKTVELRFNPSKVGLHQAKVNIITQTDTLIQNITGIGIQPTIQIVNDLIDFGYVDIGIAKDTLQAVTIKNISNVEIDIKNTYHSGPNDKDFSTIKGGGAFKLPAGETAKLDMRFLPTSVGRTSGTLMFEYDGIGSPAVVQLFGAGIGGVASLKLDTIDTETSKIVEFPVKLTLDSKVLKSGANAVNFEISYNNTLLYPLENYPITNKDGFATLSFKNVPLSTDPIQTLETLKFRTGLGNAIETPLTISNFELLGTTEEIDLTLKDGNLKLTDVCFDGGVRLLNPNSVVSMANISPNPVNSIITIDVNLIEIGNTEVSIYNLLGEKVKTVFSKDITETGSISINSDLSDLSIGQYIVIFKTPTYLEKNNILLIK